MLFCLPFIKQDVHNKIDRVNKVAKTSVLISFARYISKFGNIHLPTSNFGKEKNLVNLWHQEGKEMESQLQSQPL